VERFLHPEPASLQGFVRRTARFVQWCANNFPEINVKKTKEMEIDFRRNKTPLPPMTINGESVDRVTTYKYLGI
jgi:hypothetical protein